MSNISIQFMAAVIAVAVSLAIFGKSLEEAAMPVLTEVRVRNVSVEGNRVFWTAYFCKLRDVRIHSASFVYFYAGNKKAGRPVNVINESRGAPVDSANSRPPGCIENSFSAMIPPDHIAGDIIVGSVWYESFHPFWSLQQDFGRVKLP